VTAAINGSHGTWPLELLTQCARRGGARKTIPPRATTCLADHNDQADPGRWSEFRQVLRLSTVLDHVATVVRGGIVLSKMAYSLHQLQVPTQLVAILWSVGFCYPVDVGVLR